MDEQSSSAKAAEDEPGLVAQAALRLTAWTERWIPAAFIFALLATVLVFGAALIWTPSSPLQVLDAWGNGFWDLITFTLQMSLIIITGHVLATSAPMGKAIRAIAAWPTTPRGAVTLVAFFAMFSSWFNWGFSVIFSAVLAKEVKYLPLPETAYQMATERLRTMQTGTGFGGVPEVGLPVEEILKRPPKA